MSKKWRPKIGKNQPLVIQKLTTNPKSIARVVGFGEGRDPRDGVGGGKIPPWVRKEGLRTEGASKPPPRRGPTPRCMCRKCFTIRTFGSRKSPRHAQVGESISALIIYCCGASSGTFFPQRQTLRASKSLMLECVKRRPFCRLKVYNCYPCVERARSSQRFLATLWVGTWGIKTPKLVTLARLCGRQLYDHSYKNKHTSTIFWAFHF